jgi:opacity protein-like surface antigen
MIRRTMLALGLVAVTAASASAQVLGIPVVNNGAASGINIGADVGMPNADYGSGTAIGGRASVGLGFFGVGVALSHYSPKGESGLWSEGANATLRLIGGPLVPFRITLQAGAGRWSVEGADYLHVPVSIGFSGTIPNPAFAIKPWIAPRIDYLRGSFGGNSSSSTNFGISGGIDLSFLNGLTVRAAYDRVNDSGAHPSIFSLGLGFAP